MDAELQGRVAVVTGAGIRLGRALAEALASRGADVVVHFHGSRQGAEETVAAVEASGCRAELVQADLSDPGQVARVFEAADRLGGCDLLINSAAIFGRKPITEIDDEAWRRMLDTNLSAPFYCCRAAVPSMKRKGRGDILNIVDVIGGLRAFGGYSHYAPTKAGLKMLTEVLALELAPTIRVNAIAPGTVIFPESYAEALREKVTSKIPLKRIGSAEDVVQAAMFLLHPERFVTGQVLALDGGRAIA